MTTSDDTSAARFRVSDIECVILGSGTSAGVPVIGCKCEVCSSEDPRDRRSRPSACLRFRDSQGDERILLLDASPDLREQAIRHGVGRCDAILFTHAHFDHIFGLDDVRRFNVLMNSAIDVYAERATLDSLERVYDYIFRREIDPNPSWVASLAAHEIRETNAFELFGLRVTPLRVYHGRLPILGFRVDALDGCGALARVGPLPFAYLTDVSAIPEETWPYLGGLETLVLDMLRYRRHPTHLSVDEAIEIAGRIGASRTWFIHMTHEILHRDLDARLPAGMALAYDGLRVRGSE